CSATSGPHSRTRTRRCACSESRGSPAIAASRSPWRAVTTSTPPARSRARPPPRSRWNWREPAHWQPSTQGTRRMNGNSGYAVFFFPQALEALGEAIKPYLQDSPAGPHVLCREIDTGGALIEMSLEGVTADGRTVQLDLMVPGSMVRMIVSSQADGDFGFGPRTPPPVP